MSEITATCELDNEDRIRAYATGSGRTELLCSTSTDGAGVWLSPDALRTFARGLLSLADEGDQRQGKAKPETPAESVKVGDKFRVTEEDCNYATVKVGEILTVTELAGFSGFYTDGDALEPDGSWHFRASHIGNGLKRVTDNEPTAVKVGDTVRVLVDDSSLRHGEFVGRTGRLISIDDDSAPYLVKFGNGDHGAADGEWYCEKVEKAAPPTPDDASDDEITESPREALLRRARKLSAPSASDADVLSFARFLAGE